MFLRQARSWGVPLLLLATSSSPAGADAADGPAAQALFDQAKKLVAKGSIAEACPKFEESHRLDPALGTLLNWADCLERSGRLASAWSKFVDVQDLAQAAGRTKVEQIARGRIAKLAPRLANLVLDVDKSSKVPGLEVTRDATKVGPAQWGVAIPIDPGPHVLRAAAAGYKPWEMQVDIAATSSTSTVRVPRLEALSVSAPSRLAPVPVAADRVEDARTDSREATSASGHFGAQKGFAIATASVGVAGAVVGTMFGLKSKAKHDEAGPHCAGQFCQDTLGEKLRDDARAAGNVSTVAFVAGGVALAGGAILWLTAGSSAPDSARARIEVGPGTVVVNGHF